MSTIADTYRFYLDLPDQGYVQAYPKNSSLTWVDKKQRDFRFFERLLDTELVFVDQQKGDILDFAPLAALLRQGRVCDKVGLRIDKYCECDASWREGFWMGYLRLSEGEWNFSRSKVTIKPQVESTYTCLTERWEQEVNLFDYGDPPQTISTLLGQIQEQTCSYQIAGEPNQYNQNNLPAPNSSCLDDPETWTLIRQQGDWESSELPGEPQEGGWYHASRWAREFVEGGSEPDGDGWIAVSGGWARPVTVYFRDEEYEPLYYIKRWGVVGWNGNASVSGFANAKSLNSILVDLVEEYCGVSVISDFLNINPDGTAPSNKYYTQAAIDAHDLRLLTTSDLSLEDESESATSMPATLKELLEDLKDTFNLDITIESGNLRIEHVSYFENDAADFRLNLRLKAFERWIAEKWVFTYLDRDMPKQELFFWAQETDGEGSDFDGTPITYDNNCVNDRVEQVEKVVKTDLFVTNVQGIIGNEDFFDTKYIVLISMYASIMNSSTGALSGVLKINAGLSWANLHANYWDYNRPFRRGFINFIDSPMYRPQKLRKQTPITIPMQCSDWIDEFDPLHPVQTQMGWGQIDEARYDDPKEFLTLTLLHT